MGTRAHEYHPASWIANRSRISVCVRDRCDPMSVQSRTPANPCPICQGHPALPQGRGIRCFGFGTDRYAHCTREEFAGALSPHKGGDTYAHRLSGPCRCGLTHGDAAPIDPVHSVRRVESEAPRLWSVPDSHVEMRHDYLDEKGALAWQLCRFWRQFRTEHGGAKGMPRHIGADGRWYFGQGRWKGNHTKPLYREAEALAELRLGGHVFIVEGERDADALWEAGLVATTAGSAKAFRAGQAERIAAAITDGDDHPDRDVAAMAHAEITIIGDADQDGIDGAKKTRRLLLEACTRLRGRVRALLPPDGVKDVSEWIASRRAAA